MKCEDVKGRDLIEGYLVGRLDESERESFERHYFECEACFEDLQTFRALRSVRVVLIGRLC